MFSVLIVVFPLCCVFWRLPLHPPLSVWTAGSGAAAAGGDDDDDDDADWPQSLSFTALPQSSAPTPITVWLYAWHGKHN